MFHNSCIAMFHFFPKSHKIFSIYGSILLSFLVYYQ